MSNRINNNKRRASSDDAHIPARRTLRTLSGTGINYSGLQLNIIRNQPVVRLARISESDLLPIAEASIEAADNNETIVESTNDKQVANNNNNRRMAVAHRRGVSSDVDAPLPSSNEEQSIAILSPCEQSSGNTEQCIENCASSDQALSVVTSEVIEQSVAVCASRNQACSVGLSENTENFVAICSSISQASSVPSSENSEQSVAICASSDEASSVVPISSREPMVVLSRLTEEQLRLYDFPDGDDDDDNGSQSSSQSAPGEPVIFTKYEFLRGARTNSRLMFVHDIEHLYFFRYKSADGDVYMCRDRKKCKAKAVIDENSVCKQIGSAPHTNPSVREEYENIILRNNIRKDCTDDDILRQQNLRSIYDKRSVQ